jgi:hypothetical protein
MAETYAVTTQVSVAFDWVMEYCRRNPVDTVNLATQAFVWSLYPQRVQQAPAVPALPQWEGPAKPQQSIPVKSRKRS